MMVNFFRNVLNSIYSPTFYAEIPSKGLKGALGYFVLLILLLTAVQTSTVAKPLLADASDNILDMVSKVVSQYPDELEIIVKNGTASTNVEEPYFVTLPNSAGSDIKNLIVIDTMTPYSASGFNNYQALVWLTKDSLFWKEHNSFQVRSIVLSQLGDFKLNKQTLGNMVDQLSPWIKFIGPLLFVFAILGFFMLYSFRLVYLLLLALLIWLLSIIFHWSLNYSSSYKIGLYAMTLGLVIELVAGLLKLQTFNFMFTLLTILVVVVNMIQVKKV